MKIIIKKTGKVEDVSSGYAVNFLLPRGLAKIATKHRLEKIKKEKREKQKLKKKGLLKDRQMAEKLDGKVVTFKVVAGKAGKIHGSIGKKEIAKELKILKPEVILDQPIKKVGEYKVELKFGVAKAGVKIKVEA